MSSYNELYARGLSAIAPRSAVWGPTIGYRNMNWVRTWVDASIDARKVNAA